MIFGAASTGNSDQIAHEWTAWLLSQPFGRWLVGGAGIAFLITSIGAVVKAVRADFDRRLDAKKAQMEIVTELGVAGFLARGFVFAMIGLFLLFAAVHSRSNEAKGLAGALQVIQHQPYGSFLIAITAAGLLAFGVYGIAEELTAGSLRLDCYHAVTTPFVARKTAQLGLGTVGSSRGASC
jgi:hypothetical protein